MKPPHTRYRSITDLVREMLDSGAFISNRHAAETLRCGVKAIHAARRRIDAGCRPANGSGWTDERVERLRELHAKGCTSRQIAGDLGGVSRCAVIGKLHRIGLLAHPNAKNRGGRIGGLKTSKSRPTFQKPISPVRAILCDGLPIPAPAETDIARVSVMDVEPHHCRWVCSEEGDPLYAPRFCGADKVPGLVYCPPHAKRAFAPPQVRTIRVHVQQQRELQVA